MDFIRIVCLLSFAFMCSSLPPPVDLGLDVLKVANDHMHDVKQKAPTIVYD